jgi:hypothetical protein
MMAPTEPMELELAAATVLHGAQPRQIRNKTIALPTKAATAAFDEVFAALDRGLEEAKGTIVSPMPSSAAIDPQPFRSVANQLDRQRERLSQLLREIEGGASI